MRVFGFPEIGLCTGDSGLAIQLSDAVMNSLESEEMGLSSFSLLPDSLASGV